MTDWAALQRSGRYDLIAALLIEQCSAFDVDALRQDPYGAIDRSCELDVSIQDHLSDGCGGGYYRPRPPTIYLHRSILRRDNFTILHELGHHLQQHHPEWGFLLLDLSADAAKLTEEGVANQIAIQILMPAIEESLGCDAHPADVMRGLYENTVASRSAVLHRVAELMPPTARWILAVASTDGVVEASATTYGDAQPAKGSQQPAFSALAEEALAGPVRRDLLEGIRYTTGSELADMRAEAVLDGEGRYLFVALTPAARFGRGTVVWRTYECTSPACGRTFEARYVRQYCERCGEPHCTWCDRCSCDPTNTGKFCPRCFMLLTPVEVATGSHEC
jgi:hypothetical protein